MWKNANRAADVQMAGLKKKCDSAHLSFAVPTFYFQSKVSRPSYFFDLLTLLAERNALTMVGIHLHTPARHLSLLAHFGLAIGMPSVSRISRVDSIGGLLSWHE